MSTPQAIHRGATAKVTPGGTEERQTIAIQIHLPDFHLPKWNIPWKQLRPWLLCPVAIVVIITGGKLMIDRSSRHSTPVDSTPVNVQATVALGYRPLVPSARATGEKSPSAPKYDKERKLYSYNDLYRGSSLTIDQQSIPANFKDNPEAVKKFVEGTVHATESFTTILDKAYLYTDVASGSQRITIRR